MFDAKNNEEKELEALYFKGFTGPLLLTTYLMHGKMCIRLPRTKFTKIAVVFTLTHNYLIKGKKCEINSYKQLKHLISIII